MRDLLSICSPGARTARLIARFLIACGVIITVLACDSTVLEVDSLSISDRINTPPGDFFAEIVLARTDPQFSAATDNLLANGSFEDGYAGWTDCSSNKSGATTNIVNDAQQGGSAVELTSDTCFYQTVEVATNDEINLSCYAKTLDELRWTGMGVGFSDDNWNVLSQSSPTVISSNSYTRYDVRASVPATTRYVSMWFYSETRALVDNCVLTYARDRTPPSNPTTSNLLANAAFDQTSNNMPDNWVNYCGGNASASQESDQADLILGGGACVSQNFNTSTLVAMQNKPIEFRCSIDYTDTRYAEVLVHLDGTDYVAQIDPNGNEVVGNFRAPPTINRGFISLYSEGKPNTLRVTDCDLKVVKNQPEPTKPKEPPQPRIDVSNGLEGPDSWTAGIPFDYTITVTNTGNEALTDVSIESDNIEDCIINYARLNVGETKTAFCTNSTWTTITTAGTSFSHVVSVTAISDSGQTVTDSDQSGNSRGRLSNDLRPRLVITPESYSVNEGDTVTFLVEAANAGTLSDGNINLITSNVADCNREFSTPIISGTLMRYKCEAKNVSPPFFATFTSPGTIDGNNQTLVSSVELLQIGTSGIHLRPTGDSPGFIPVNSIGENYSVEIENTGSVNLTSLRLSNDTYDCDEEIEELTPRSVERFSCYVPADEATIDEGKVVNSTITVTAEAPDGTQLQDSVEVFAFREDDLRLEITDGRDNNIFIAANPGVQKTLILTLHNSGYLPITVLDSVQINTSSTQTENYSDCEQKLSALSKDPTFRLEPGQSQEVSCEFLASTNATMVARYGSEQLPGYLQNSTQYNVWLASSKTRPADTKTILLKEFTTDPSALPDPTIDPARNREIPINGNFASVNTDGTPTGWLNSCEGTVDITRNNSVELRSDGCLRYMLNPEQLAMLAGNSYKLACRVLRNSQSASISVILDNNTAQVPSTKHSYSFTVTSEVLEDDAPYPVSTGYIELKNRTGISEYSDCSLTITGQTGSTASIDVRNQLEGFDTYSGYGDFEFELVVTNNGQVPLQDIQLSSDRLDCDTNFASLEVNEIKHAVCSTTEPLKHWNQQLAHTVLATASTADGEIVSDEDYAEHLATETLSQTRINLTQIITPSGSDAVVRVQLANGVGYPIDYIESTQCNNIGCEISPCARTVSPALEHGKTLEYICIVDPALGRTLEVDVDEPGPGGFSREATLLLR